MGQLAELLLAALPVAPKQKYTRINHITGKNVKQTGIINRMDSSPRASNIPGLSILCALLGLGGLFFAGTGIFLLLRNAGLYGAAAFLVGVLMAAAGWGLYHFKRWGVVLFGLLTIAGSINHLHRTLYRYNDLSQAGVETVLTALVSLLAAILIPVGLFYLMIIFWRKAQ